jgi:hypothetical protein
MKCHSRIDLWIHDRDVPWRRTGVRNLFVRGINHRRRFQNEWLTRRFLICNGDNFGPVSGRDRFVSVAE